MKIFLLLLSTLLVFAVSAQQSLKDALYSGKLRLDTGTVIKKGDDLTSRMDSVKRKPAEVPVVKVLDTISVSEAGGILPDSTTTAVVDSGGIFLTDAPLVTAPAGTPATGTPAEAVPGPATNNKIWKDYITELTGTLRTEVMTSKKIKSGTYSVLIDYEIGVDGTISVSNVSSSPANSFIEEQVKERITLTAPTLTPLLNSYGKPRKAPKKQTIVLNK
jgi:hypothetical protein